MRFTLTIEADHWLEISSLFNASGQEVLPNEPTDEEPQIEVETPAPKKPRKGRAAKQDTPDTKSSPESSDGETATTDASPSDEPVTFEDLRAKASELMDSGKVDGRAIQEMLKEKFGVAAFGPLPQESYAACLAELNNL